MIFSFMLRIECFLPSARISETWNGNRIFSFAAWKRKWTDLELLLLLDERVTIVVAGVRLAIALLWNGLTATLTVGTAPLAFAHGQIRKAFIHNVVVGFHPYAAVLFVFFRHDLGQEVYFVVLAGVALFTHTPVASWNQFWVVVRLARDVGLVLSAWMNRRFSLRSFPTLDSLINRVLLRNWLQRFDG